MRSSSRGYRHPTNSSLPNGGEVAGSLDDFFSGKGGVASQARTSGFKIREWEILKHAGFGDLTRESVLKSIEI